MEGGLHTTGVFKHGTPGYPLVSVVTVVRNGARHLEQTIQSVLSQDYPNVEYIILDGGSTDGTLAIVQRYERRVDYYRSAPDGGIYHAMNQGIALCHGELIGLKNADDWFAPGAISQVVRTWQQTNAEVVYGDTYTVWQEVPLRLSLFKSNHAGLGSGQAIDHRNMFLPAPLYKAMPYNTRYRIAADYDLMLRLWQRGATFAHTGSVLGYKRRGGVSASLQTVREVFTLNRAYLGLAIALKIYTRSLYGMGLYGYGNRLLATVLGPERFARFKARK